jgi:hypothetical protein
MFERRTSLLLRDSGEKINKLSQGDSVSAGTLLGAITSDDRKSEAQRLDAAIRTAAPSFPAGAAGQLGSGPQRAYAVLSGLGATALD